MKTLRIYADTSVIGGCYDEEFAEDSWRLIEMARAGEITLVISAVVLRELSTAPTRVREVLDRLPQASLEIVTVREEALRLASAYVQEGIVGPSSLDDAVHVAIATVAACDAIVSWNFKHIVRLDRIRLYNKVNGAQGYHELVILTPMEVRRDTDPQGQQDV
jgi:predicted nucleic acid-binding protein